MAKKKKTKKQKVIADYRKKMKAVQPAMPKTVTAKPSKPKKQPVKKREVSKTIQSTEVDFVTPEIQQNKAYVVKDLRKTIIISTVIIFVILGLWWATSIQGWSLTNLLSV